VTVSAAKEEVQDASLLLKLLQTEMTRHAIQQLSIPQPDWQETFVTAVL